MNSTNFLVMKMIANGYKVDLIREWDVRNKDEAKIVRMEPIGMIKFVHYNDA